MTGRYEFDPATGLHKLTSEANHRDWMNEYYDTISLCSPNLRKPIIGTAQGLINYYINHSSDKAKKHMAKIQKHTGLWSKLKYGENI